jgi:hypothetical protein
MTASATAATAAAICVLHYLNRPIPESAVRWLQEQAHPQGGFAAIRLPAGAIAPDLLSTATALHALSLVAALADDMREKHLDYLDTLWSPQGGFRGHRATTLWTEELHFAVCFGLFPPMTPPMDHDALQPQSRLCDRLLAPGFAGFWEGHSVQQLPMTSDGGLRPGHRR